MCIQQLLPESEDIESPENFSIAFGRMESLSHIGYRLTYAVTAVM